MTYTFMHAANSIVIIMIWPAIQPLTGSKVKAVVKLYLTYRGVKSYQLSFFGSGNYIHVNYYLKVDAAEL
jgi:hypothetical protein